MTYIETGKLLESPMNPRKSMDEDAIRQLAESMREHGFRQHCPCVVRPFENGKFEIAAGHRRVRAAAMAGIPRVPCIVIDGDAKFLDVLTFDNSGREDIHPLHEAEGWVQWMKQTGKAVIDVASRVGQSKEYVYQRLKYLDLDSVAKAAFLRREITEGHAILIARLDPAEQRSAVNYARDGASVRGLASFIHSKTKAQEPPKNPHPCADLKEEIRLRDALIVELRSEIGHWKAKATEP